METNEQIFNSKMEGIPEDLYQDYPAFRQFCLELMGLARQAERKENLKLRKGIKKSIKTIKDAGYSLSKDCACTRCVVGNQLKKLLDGDE